MRPPNLPLVVVDSCCFIAVLINEQRAENRADRAAHILAEHNNKHIVIMPSIVYLETLGTAQKGNNGKDGHRPDRMRQNLDKARSYLENSGFVPGEFTEAVANKSIDLMPQFGLKGMDASVLALAMLHEATMLYTFDSDLLKVGDQIEGLSVTMPPLPELSPLFDS